MGALEMVFLDIGGVLYGDAGYREALRRALRELGARFSDQEFDAEYARCRRDQSGSFRRRLTRRFLGPDADLDAVERHAGAWWHYTPEDLEPDALPTVRELARSYRLGLVANQPSGVRRALARDGLEPYFEVRAVSDDVRLEKPDPRIFVHALASAGVRGDRAVMVGDRLDYDVRPAREAGMRAVWLLRGEAPDDPTPEQLAEPDAAIRSLRELREVLEEL
ncbi:MAG TPA: HAD family hydrolase [Actinomycetota bacterium]|nr:HAD family hydrolase [Actinomycetota bacterium]